MELHEPKNLYELLTLNMEQRFANRVAFRWYDADQDVVVEKHFGEYAQDIRRAVNYYLSTIPDIQGKRVCVWSNNSYHYAVNCYGVMMAGGVIVPMNQRKSWEELHRELELVEPSAILTDGDDYGCNEEMQADYGSLLRPMDAYKAYEPAELVNRIQPEELMVLMFTSGMETDLNELKRCGKSAFLIALAGVLLPLLGGFVVGHYFNDPTLLVNNTPGPQGSLLLQNVFLGIILTATSVSITVETLRELGKLRGTAGSVILAAAIIDDVLGIVALTIVTSFSDDSVHVGLVLLKILLFFVFAVVAGVSFARSYRWWTGKTEENRTQHAIVAFVFCLLMAYLAEEVFGVADITGAFVAGLVLANATTGERSLYLSDKFESVSFLYLSPVFFASIGLQVVLSAMNLHILLFAVVLTIVAILTKILGCGLGARLCRQRQARGMTVESVAQSLGVTPQEVEAWEKDTADPTDQQLMDLAALYGGTLADLFRR